MKKLIVLLFILSISISSFSQLAVGSKREIKQFYKTKTMVVLDGGMFGSAYDVKIQEVVKKHWKATDYEFINSSQLGDLQNNPKYSFLVRVDVDFYNQDKMRAKYVFLTLALGGNAGDINNMPKVASFPLSYEGVMNDNYLYKLGIGIQFMQNHVALTKQNTDLNDRNIIKYYNKNQTNVNDKELYVIEDELEEKIRSMDKIKKVYPGTVKFVTAEEIEKAINEKNKDVVFLHKIGPEGGKEKARCWKLILGASDAQMYYWDHHIIKPFKGNAANADGFLESDFRKLKRR